MGEALGLLAKGIGRYSQSALEHLQSFKQPAMDAFNNVKTNAMDKLNQFKNMNSGGMLNESANNAGAAVNNSGGGTLLGRAVDYAKKNAFTGFQNPTKGFMGKAFTGLTVAGALPELKEGANNAQRINGMLTSRQGKYF